MIDKDCSVQKLGCRERYQGVSTISLLVIRVFSITAGGAQAQNYTSTSTHVHCQSSQSVAYEIVDSERLSKTSSLLPLVQVVAHAEPVIQRFAISRSVLLAIETARLLEEEKGVPMGPTTWRRSMSNVIGDKGQTRGQDVVGTGLEAWLDPVKNGTETTPGGEGGVKV